MIYGEWRVIRQHGHGNGGLRVWVENIRTGERAFHILTANLTANV